MKDWKKHILPVATGAAVIGIGTAVITNASGLENLFEPDQFKRFENRYHADDYNYVAGDGEKTELADQDKDSQENSGSDNEQSILASERKDKEKPGESDLSSLRLTDQTELPDAHETGSGYEIADRENSTLPDIRLPDMEDSYAGNGEHGKDSTVAAHPDNTMNTDNGTNAGGAEENAAADKGPVSDIVPTPDVTPAPDATPDMIPTPTPTPTPTPIPTPDPTPDVDPEEERKPTSWESDQLKPKEQPTLPDGTILTELTARFSDEKPYYTLGETFDPSDVTVEVSWKKNGETGTTEVSYGGEDGYTVIFSTLNADTQSAVFYYRGLSARAEYRVLASGVTIQYYAESNGEIYGLAFPDASLQELLGSKTDTADNKGYEALIKLTSQSYRIANNGRKTIDLSMAHSCMIDLLGDTKVTSTLREQTTSGTYQSLVFLEQDEKGYLTKMLSGFRQIDNKQLKDEQGYVYYPAYDWGMNSRAVVDVVTSVPDGYKIKREVTGRAEDEKFPAVNWSWWPNTAYHADQVLEQYTGADENAEVPMGVTALKFKMEPNDRVKTLTIPQSVLRMDYGSIAKAFPELQNYGKSEDVEYHGYQVGDDGALYSEDGKTLLSVPAGKSSFTVPETVTALGDHCFAGLKDTCSLIFKSAAPPQNMENTGFSGTVYVPDSEQDLVLRQYYFAFGKEFSGTLLADGKDTSRTSYFLEEDASGTLVLYRDKDLTILSAVAPTVTDSWTVPDAVERIDGRAFYGCDDLSDLTISHPLTLAEGSLEDLGWGQTITVQSRNVTAEGNLFGEPGELPELTVYVPMELLEEYTNQWSQVLDPLYGDGTAAALLRSTTGEYLYEDGAKYEKLISNEGESYRLIRVYQTDKTVLQVLEGTEEVESGAFSRLTNLEILCLPESLNSLDLQEVEELSALETVTLNNPNTEFSTTARSFATADILKAGEDYDSFFLENQVLYGQKSAGYCLLNAPTDLSGEVLVKDGTVSLEERAFYGCNRISSLAFESPETLTYIGELCFAENDRTETIDLKDCTSLISIGKGAFQNDTNLQRIDLPDSITTLSEELCRGCSNLFIVEASGITTIEDRVFYECANLLDDTVRQKLADPVAPLLTRVESIGDAAFYGCKYLKNVVLPDTLKQIGESCFENCTRLETLECNGSLTAISRYCFYGCKNLTGIQLGEQQKNTLYLIGVEAFGDCSALMEVDLKELSELTYLGEGAFENCAQLSLVKLPEHVTELPEDCFSGCESLSLLQLYASSVSTFTEDSFGGSIPKGINIWVPDSICEAYAAVYEKFSDLVVFAGIDENKKIMNNMVFQNTENGWVLSEVLRNFEGICTIPEDTSIIAEGVFENNDRITGLVIPENVSVTLSSRCFKGCTNLKSVELYGEINGWEEETFMDCTGLTTFIAGTGTSYYKYVIDRIGTRAFKDCTALVSVTFYFNTACFGEECFSGCTSLPGIGFTYFSRVALEKLEDSVFENCSSLRTFLTSKFTGLTTIGAYVFRNCDAMVSPSVPANVTSMGEGCFMNCDNLTSVSIYGALEEYPKDCFKNCSKLNRTGGTDAAFNGLKRIGESAYEGCTSLTISVSWNLGRYSNLEEIGDFAFKDCKNLTMEMDTTKGYLSGSLKTLGNGVFDGCSNLTALYFIGVTPPSIGSMDLSTMAEEFVIRVPDSQDSGDDVYNAYLKILSQAVGEDKAKEILDSLTDGAKERSETSETSETLNLDAAEEQQTENVNAAEVLPEIPEDSGISEEKQEPAAPQEQKESEQESSEEPSKEPEQELSEEPSKEPEQELSEEPSKEPEKPSEESSEESGQKSSEEPAEEPVQESAEGPTEEPENHTEENMP